MTKLAESTGLVFDVAHLSGVGVEELQTVADYCRAKRKFRTAAFSNVCWGIVIVALGVGCAAGTSRAFLVAVGGLLIVGGIWLFFVQSYLSLSLNCIALGLIGALTTFAVILIILDPPRPVDSGVRVIFCIAFGAAQILSAVFSFLRVRSDLNVIEQPPPVQLRQSIQLLKRRIKKSRFSKDPSVIEFEDSGGRRPRKWKGLLLDDVAVFLEVGGELTEDLNLPDMLFATRDEVGIMPTSKSFLGRRVKASIEIRNYQRNSKIHLKSLERYERWKNQFAVQ
jgi:hypothetical protein